MLLNSNLIGSKVTICHSCMRCLYCLVYHVCTKAFKMRFTGFLALFMRSVFFDTPLMSAAMPEKADFLTKRVTVHSVHKAKVYTLFKRPEQWVRLQCTNGRLIHAKLW